MTASRDGKKLTDEERNILGQWLMRNMVNGKLRRGAITEAAIIFSISRQTVTNWWNATKGQVALGQPVLLQGKQKGSKHRDRMEVDVDAVKALTMLDRSSIRRMAGKLNISKSLLGVWIKQKMFRAHTSAIKPALTPQNRIARLRWSLSHLDSSMGCGAVKYQSMHNVVHIDEKWFYMTKTSDRYYMLPEETDPYRSCKSKRFITKVMFMCAVSRPQIGEDGSILFDGKFGIFPFTLQEPAKRNSKNRTKGTLENKPIQSITKAVIKDCIINKIIPSIKAKWPPNASKQITIQQDNAKPHIAHNDPEFMKAANSDGFNITLVCQPPNSPDCNINDLGFFRAIQSLQHFKKANGVDDILQNVEDAFQEHSMVKLNNNFLTLQGCYTEIMKVKGCNNYKIPHIGKERLIRAGALPECLEVDESLIRECLDFLALDENNGGAAYNIGQLQDVFSL